MQIIRASLWDEKFDGQYRAITTNGVVKSDGRLVMGKGIALEACRRHKDLSFKLGVLVKAGGNHCYILHKERLISFPTKHNWKNNSDIKLIEQSCIELVSLCDWFSIGEVYLPKPGCGNGGLNWEKEVKQVIEPLFDDRFYICDV